MLQTKDSTATALLPDRRTPPPARHAAPALVAELADADDFKRLAGRQAVRYRREGQVLSVLSLQVQFDSPPDPALAERLLAECARRLCSRVRATDCVARWQGTHFGVLLPRCEPVQAEAVLARLTRFAGGNYRLDDLLLHVSVHGQALGAAIP